MIKNSLFPYDVDYAARILRRFPVTHSSMQESSVLFADSLASSVVGLFVVTLLGVVVAVGAGCSDVGAAIGLPNLMFFSLQ